MTAKAPLLIDSEKIPLEMKQHRHWLVWKREVRNGKETKVPYQALDPRRKAAADNPRTWASFDDAMAAYKAGGLGGIGFVFSAADPYTGVDLDGCVDPATGEIAPWALEIIDPLDSYAELSPSGTGVHIIAKGKLPAGGRKQGPIEMYDRDRFFTITGAVIGNREVVQDRQAELEALHARVFAKPEREVRRDRGPAVTLELDDAALLEKIRNSKQGAKFSALWSGDISGYSSQSEADSALCHILYFWTGGDAARIDSLFRQSGLMRLKWDEKHYSDGATYGQKTIQRALERGGEVIGEGPTVTVGPEGVKAKTQKGTDAPDLLIYLRTDYGNAERLAALHGADIRFCPELGWLIYDGYRWRVDSGAGITRRALETARALFAQADREGDSDRRAEWIKYSLQSEKKGALENAIALAKSIPGMTVSISEFDKDPMLLNVANGTIDLHTGEMRPHRREDLITKLAPVSYDPAAVCPLWNEFQRTITDGDQDLIEFKRRAFGYSLTGNTSEEVLFIAYGNGANGKSTEMNTVGKILGDYATTAQFDTFAVRKNEGVRDDIADLAGARFISASEGETRQRLAEGLVKQLTGGDPMKARHLYQSLFTFVPTFKLWLATNHKPIIRGTDHGIWRRIRLVPYTVTIAEERRDKNLKRKLEAEYSGIMNWLIKGCLEWQAEGLGTAEAVRTATAGYKQESDALAGFISSCCIVDELASETSKRLYDAYTQWCDENGEEPFSSNMFGRMLTERGFLSHTERVGGKPMKVWAGICLIEGEGG